jgi:hypothetical protein
MRMRGPPRLQKNSKSRYLRSNLTSKQKIISSNQLLLELLKSGVLGIRLVRNRVFRASPEDMVIRYSCTTNFVAASS